MTASMASEATYRGTVYPWSVRFVHEMRNAETGEIAATCETTGVHMDRAQRKSAPCAHAIRAAVEKHVVMSEPVIA